MELGFGGGWGSQGVGQGYGLSLRTCIFSFLFNNDIINLVAGRKKKWSFVSCLLLMKQEGSGQGTAFKRMT